MSKEHRCQAKEVFVVGFVPSYLLTNKKYISLDPFIDPLIQDIERGFTEGKLVYNFVFMPISAYCKQLVEIY